MRATVERSHLLKSLGHVHRVVERRNTIPILSNVLVKADGGKLTLKATDLDLEVTETVPAEIGQAGATTVPAHILYDIVRKLPDGAEVSLDTGDGSQLTVKSGPLALHAAGAAGGRLPRPHHRRLPDPLPPPGERRSRS